MKNKRKEKLNSKLEKIQFWSGANAMSGIIQDNQQNDN